LSKKTFFYPPLAAALYPFLAGPCVREGSEPVRRKWPGRWRLDVAGWRELVAYWKQENEVNCVVSISSSRDQTKKARNHARFTWPSHNTHTQILPALYTNSRKQTTAWILNSPFFLSLPSSFWACDTRTCYCSQSFCFLLIYSFSYLRFFLILSSFCHLI
jgi:hypothetical protein